MFRFSGFSRPSRRGWVTSGLCAGLVGLVALAVSRACSDGGERAVRPQAGQHRAGPNPVDPHTAAEVPGHAEIETEPGPALPVEVRGIVFLPDGSLAGRGVQAWALSKEVMGPELVATTNDVGRFRCERRVAAEIRVAFVVASNNRALRSYPIVLALAPDSGPHHVAMHLRGTARLELHAVRSNIAGPVEFLVTELPSNPTGRPVPPIEYGRLATVDRLVKSDDRGVSIVQVRPGPVRVRARADDRSPWGPTVEDELNVGQERRLDVAVGDSTTTLTVRVTDAAGPVAGAWVRLSDRTLRFGNERAGDETAHLITDQRGRVVVMPPAASFPLAIAVGTKRHYVNSASVPYQKSARVVEMQLARRPSVRLELVGAGATLSSVPVRWRVRARGDSSTEKPEPGPAGVRGLQMFLGGPRVQPARTVGSYDFFAPAPGNYLVEGEVQGGYRFAVPVAGRDFGTVKRVELPKGRLVVLEHARAEFAAYGTLARSTHVLWTADGEPRRSSPRVSWDPTAASRSNPFWVPTKHRFATVIGETPQHLPWKAHTVPVPTDAASVTVDVDTAFAGTASYGTVRLSVRGGGEALGLAGFEILAWGEGAPEEPALHQAAGAFFRGELGACDGVFRLRPGKYSFKLHPRFGEFGWSTIDVVAGVTNEVVLDAW